MANIINDLTPAHIRKLVDTIYDGEPTVAGYLFQIKHIAPARNNEILIWLVKNKITGKKLIEFFVTERDDDKGMSVLNGVTHILNRLDGTDKKVKEINLAEFNRK